MKFMIVEIMTMNMVFWEIRLEFIDYDRETGTSYLNLALHYAGVDLTKFLQQNQRASDTELIKVRMLV